MNVYVVGRMGVYMQGIFGIYSTEEEARIRVSECLNLEPDEYHDFYIVKTTVDKGIFFDPSREGWIGAKLC